jgi:hypothetical protein
MKKSAKWKKWNDRHFCPVDKSTPSKRSSIFWTQKHRCTYVYSFLSHKFDRVWKINSARNLLVVFNPTGSRLEGLLLFVFELSHWCLGALRGCRPSWCVQFHDSHKSEISAKHHSNKKGVIGVRWLLLTHPDSGVILAWLIFHLNPDGCP